jgi:hypothetical protein
MSDWTNIEVLSKNLNVPRATFLQWRHRGFVPPHRHYELISKAESFDLDNTVTAKMLHKQWLSNSINGRKFADRGGW